MPDEIDQRLDRLATQPFRARFALRGPDRDIADSRTPSTLRQHARDIIRQRLAPAQPRKDGKQTPYRHALDRATAHRLAPSGPTTLWEDTPPADDESMGSRTRPDPRCPIRPGDPCTLCQLDVTGPADCPLVYLVMTDEELGPQLRPSSPTAPRSASTGPESELEGGVLRESDELVEGERLVAMRL